MNDTFLRPSVEVDGVPQVDGELAMVRCGVWRFLVPLRHIDRVYDAVLPAALPGCAHPVVAIQGQMVPLLFCAALLGADHASISTSDKLVLLRDGARTALLHVQAVEDVLPFTPVQSKMEPPVARELVAGFCGAPHPLAILDVPALLECATN